MTDKINPNYIPNIVNIDEPKTVKKYVEEHSSALETALSSTNQNIKTSNISSSQDPLDLIDKILSKYLIKTNEEAQEYTEQIRKKSNAIAEINRLFGLIKQSLASHVDPTKEGTTVNLGNSDTNKKYLEQINALIINDLGEPSGIEKITGKNLADSDSYRVSYTMLEKINATMTAFCNTEQVTIDANTQKFKNLMTQANAVNDEIRDLRVKIVNLSGGF